MVDAATCPRELEVTAWTGDGLIMGLRHRTLPIEGVQFHPESMLTKSGKPLLANFLAQVARVHFSRSSLGRIFVATKIPIVPDYFRTTPRVLSGHAVILPSSCAP